MIPFATSGGSGMGKTEQFLRALCPETTVWRKGGVLNGRQTGETLAEWAEEAAGR